MKWSNWFKWFGIGCIVTLIDVGLYYGIGATVEIDPMQTELFRTLSGILCAFLFCWCIRGLLLISQGEAGRITNFIQISVTTLAMLGTIGGMYFAIRGIPIVESEFGWVLISFWTLSWFYILCIELVRVALSRGGGFLGVAKTVFVEAIRMKISVSFLVLLALLICGLPFYLNEEAPLRFRIQNYLQYCLNAMTSLLSLMTVVLAAATLSFEIEKKQIFTIVTKPIRRGAHLIGKWVGLVLLNAVLLTITGIAVYGFTMFYLAQLPPKDQTDWGKLHTEVLTARASAKGKPHQPFPAMAAERVARIEEEDPQRVLHLGEEIARSQGVFNAEKSFLMDLGRNKLYSDALEEVEIDWRTLEPEESTWFVFEGLKEAKDNPTMSVQGIPVVQLRYKFISTGNLQQQEYRVPIAMRLNGNPFAYSTQDYRIVFPELVAESVQHMSIPSDSIDDDGRLVIEFTHINPYYIYEQRNYTITFSTREPMEILYAGSGFGENYFRGLLSIFIRLSWTAMLGLMAATFLSFPVAMVFSCLIVVAAMATPYLFESYGMVGNQPTNLIGMITFVLKRVGLAVSWTLQQYSMYSPTALIVDGRLFSWWMVIRCFVWVGIIWTATTGFIGWLIYRRRELARVQV